MKKILALAFFLFVVAVSSTFGQEAPIRVFECSDDFTEIGAAFQRRVHNASSGYKYFFHDESLFYFENGAEGEIFDKKAKRIIGKNKYFIFETSGGDDVEIDIYLLFLVNKEDSKAIAFFFINQWFEEVTPCSQAEINKALASYLEL